MDPEIGTEIDGRNEGGRGSWCHRFRL